MRERLLNAYLAGTISEEVFRTKSEEFKQELAEVKEEIAELKHAASKEPFNGDPALSVFEWSQEVADIWWRSKMPARREILDAVSLSRSVDDVTLYTQKRKPFDILAEGHFRQSGRGARI